MSDHLARINQALAPLDNSLIDPTARPTHPVIFIVGLPRAGSAMFYQYLISRFKIGYVSNLLASFWKAPVSGTLLQERFRDEHFISNFQSTFGNTEGVHEPHEWGWFWANSLGISKGKYHSDDLNAPSNTQLPAILAALQKICPLPWVFDNVYVSLNLELLVESLPELYVIHLERDPFYVCNSMLNARLKRHGLEGQLYSATPKNIVHIEALDDPVRQTVLQVKMLIEEINAGMAAVPAARKVQVSYETLVREPESIVDAIRSLPGLELEEKGIAFDPGFRNRNDPALIQPDLKGRLEAAWQEFFG